jgi:hypothetical protein
MTINVLRGRAATSEPETEQLAIGEPDRQIFNCPVCSRPLAVGAGRCPGCNTRFLIGVPLQRASALVAIGLLAGIALGATSVAAVAGTRPATNTPAASLAPVGGGVPTLQPATTPPTPTPGATGPAVPSVARSALSQTLTLNARLGEAGENLRSYLEAADLDSVAVASELRDLATNAKFGSELASALGGWDEATGLAGELDQVYAAVSGTARTGLAASMTNDAAYRAAATEMVAVLSRLAVLDGEARGLGAAIGLDLPESEPAG